MKNKRFNTVFWGGKTYTAPAGYVFLNIGDEIKRGDFVFNLPQSNITENIEEYKYQKYAFDSKMKQSIYLIPSIRKIRVRKIGSAIPKGFKIIKMGEIIPEGYYCRNSNTGDKNLNNWIENTNNMCANDKKLSDHGLWIAPITPVPSEPKKYTLELNKEEIVTLNNILFTRFNPYIESILEKVKKAIDFGDK